MPAAPLVGTLIGAAPEVRVVVTSRELLRLRAERNSPVGPLDVPGPDAGPHVTELARFEAIRLFDDRARAVRPDFRLDVINIDHVAEICRRLDGLPLAIELAAARIRIFEPAQLLAALGSGLRALGRGPRGAPRRHQTLVDTIGCSYDLLDEIERSAFRRLAVFVAGARRRRSTSWCSTT